MSWKCEYPSKDGAPEILKSQASPCSASSNYLNLLEVFLSIAGSNNTSQARCDFSLFACLSSFKFAGSSFSQPQFSDGSKKLLLTLFQLFCVYVQIKVRTFKPFTRLMRNQYVTNIYKHYKKDENLVYLFLVFVFLIFFMFFYLQEKIKDMEISPLPFNN